MNSLLRPKSVYMSGAKSISTEEAQQIAQAAIGDAVIRRFTVPHDSLDTYRFDVYSKGITQEGDRNQIMIDQYSGKVLSNTTTDMPQMVKTFGSWLGPLHFGTFGGMPTRIMAMITSFVPVILFLTGLVIWYPAWKKKQRKVKRKLEEAVVANDDINHK